MAHALAASDANRSLLINWLLSSGLCIGLAAILQVSVGVWALAALFSVAGYVWLALALTQDGASAGSPHLTAWDAALLSFAVSFTMQKAAYLGVFST